MSSFSVKETLPVLISAKVDEDASIAGSEFAVNAYVRVDPAINAASIRSAVFVDCFILGFGWTTTGSSTFLRDRLVAGATTESLATELRTLGVLRTGALVSSFFI
jgi:hypothetical protein